MSPLAEFPGYDSVPHRNDSRRMSRGRRWVRRPNLGRCSIFFLFNQREIKYVIRQAVSF